jgi:hypothetical protein
MFHDERQSIMVGNTEAARKEASVGAPGEDKVV